MTGATGACWLAAGQPRTQSVLQPQYGPLRESAKRAHTNRSIAPRFMSTGTQVEMQGARASNSLATQEYGGKLKVVKVEHDKNPQLIAQYKVGRGVISQCVGGCCRVL